MSAYQIGDRVSHLEWTGDWVIMAVHTTPVYPLYYSLQYIGDTSMVITAYEFELSLISRGEPAAPPRCDCGKEKAGRNDLGPHSSWCSSEE